MPFDLGAAMRVAGNTPDMYENQRQALEDLRARAQNDPSFRQQMVTQRARDWYQRYMGKPAPPMPTQQIMQPGGQPQIMQPVRQQSDTPEDGIRRLLAQLRGLGAIG